MEIQLPLTPESQSGDWLHLCCLQYTKPRYNEQMLLKMQESWLKEQDHAKGIISQKNKENFKKELSSIVIHVPLSSMYKKGQILSVKPMIL